MKSRPTVWITALVALATIATGAARVATATTSDVIIASNAVLAGASGGAFAQHTTTLEACKDYTLRLNYNMVPSGTPTENTIGFQVWNNNGSADLTDQPFGQRIWFAPGLKYYLESLRRTDVPSIEEVKFKVGCGDTNPSYTFKVFNYQPNGTLNYTLSLPGGQEG